MWVKVKAVVSVLSLLIIGIINLVTAQTCNYTANFTTDSTYANNRRIILEALPYNVYKNGGYFTANLGQDSNKVYALGLCSGDQATLAACHDNLRSTVVDLMGNCSTQKEAYSWGPSSTPSLVRYANRDFFGTLELEPTGAVYNVGDIKSNLTEFTSIWESLMDRVVKNASMGSSRFKYATGEANLTANITMHTLMQCIPGLSEKDCDSCLRQSISYYESCCLGKQGGAVLNPSCWFRWDLYTFYGPNSVATVPPPSLSSPVPSETNSTNAKEEKKQNKSNRISLVASLSATLVLAVFSALGFFIWKRRNIQVSRVPNEHSSENFTLESVAKSKEFPLIQLDILHTATNHFSDQNKLGEGGFGTVYKGTLPDGKEIAVKRLSRTSRQGLIELKNEVILIARLQHKNLVRLLGCCLEKKEKLLVYEFMHNRSLDVFLFDSSLAVQLDWQKRFNIIKGIARGIMYLHEDSRLRIIHRDLKASNVLLDHEMSPKISDFGIARIFGGDQNEANTNRVVGTYGYMAPEYTSTGHFSTKSDVFSFGVLLLEIISGKKNNGFNFSEHGESLLTFAWKLWCKDEGMELVDQLIVESFVTNEVLKCIHMGLLCVQANPTARPTMSSVVAMLESDTMALPLPTEPAFYIAQVTEPIQSISNCTLTISNLLPR